MKKILSLIIVAILIFVSSGFTTPVGATANQSSKVIKANIFNLSDQQMKNAIKIGQDGIDSFNKYEKSQLLPIIRDTMKIWQPEVTLSTPYSLIAAQSYLASNKYATYTLENAKKVKVMYLKDTSLSFSVNALGNNVDFTHGINIVLKQGANIFQPTSINGIDDFASHTTSFPDSPAYRNTLIANFDINKIDFSKTAELIYLYAGKELSVTYKVDFSKIK
ncbi:hypothetical protein PMSD_04910 [Paenibacillus macquariensis subsp. defensor]|nr:hypothetical protein PMSD_04910 [Paenibacillus macquariensis subsp. defensor]